MKTKKLYRTITILIAFIIACSLMMAGCQNETLKQYYDARVSAFETQNIDCALGQTVFVGDSITEGYDLDKFYPQSTSEVYNRGIGGDTTSGVLGRLKVSVFDLLPQKVVLMIGINDIFGGVSNNKIISNYSKILDALQSESGQSDVYVMSILPVCADFQHRDTHSINQQIITINGNIRELADKKNYTYVDLFAAMSDGDNHLIQELSSDGLHLSEEGYRIWTEKMTQLGL